MNIYKAALKEQPFTRDGFDGWLMLVEGSLMFAEHEENFLSGEYTLYPLTIDHPDLGFLDWYTSKEGP